MNNTNCLSSINFKTVSSKDYIYLHLLVMREKSKIFILFSFTIALLTCYSCVRNINTSGIWIISSNLESKTEDGKFFLADTDSSTIFKGGNMQTRTQSRSGNHSVLVTKEHPFALATEIPNVKQDSYVKVSIWRKGNSGNLVAYNNSTKDYLASKTGIEKDNNGWEKLQIKFFVPPVMPYQDLKFYVWNPGNDSIYFDDFTIFVSPNKEYPIYNESAFHIEMDTSSYLKLMKVRKRSFENGILQSADNDWVKAFVFSDTSVLKTGMRLKGDWLDHLHGNKWSYRIKVKKGRTWNRMKVFSIQNPMSRLGVNEWFLHKFLISEGVLTTRYGFVPVTFNGDSRGIYAWEEHMAKQLVESQNRREGPIIRLLEDAMWDTRVFNEEKKRYEYTNPIFETASITPFSQGKTVRNTNLKNQFLIAQELLYQYKYRLASASDIFDINSLAKYMASADVFLARHSTIWHNQRFYYNPVLCKLEPIAYDCYSDIGLDNTDKKISGYFTNNSVNNTYNEYLLLRELFNDTAFTDDYIKYLIKYSNENFLDSVFQSFNPELSFYDSLISIEFPDQYFFSEEILANAAEIREELPEYIDYANYMKQNNKTLINTSTSPVYDTAIESFMAPNLVLCYTQSSNNDSSTYICKNYFPDDIVILGLGNNRKNISEIVVPVPLVSGLQNNNCGTSNFSSSSMQMQYCFFSIAGEDKIWVTDIYPWNEPTGKPTPQQELVKNHPFPDTNIIANVIGKNVYIKQGVISANKTIIIPPGYHVLFEKGTTLDLTNKAAFISYSPVIINGSVDNPVKITSSDFSGNGFTILQAPEKSKIENAIFSNLNTLSYEGWILTGAVNFYESNVEIKKTTFYRNQCEDALNIVRSTFDLSESKFDYIYADAFDSDFSTGNVLKTEFVNIGNDAIDFSGSKILISDVYIKNASDKGISGGEDSRLTVLNTNIELSNIGLASKDLSVVTADNCNISDCNYGSVLLQKKPEYGPSKMIMTNCNFNNIKTPSLIEIGSLLITDNDSLQGNKKNVAEIFY